MAKTTALYVRSTFAYVLLFVNATISALYLLLALRTATLERRLAAQARFARRNRSIMRLACNLRCVVRNEDRIPDQACVILSNHQSSFETLVFPSLLPSYVWVLKESLTRVPFFGTALKYLAPIAIDRENPRTALKQVLGEGKAQLHAGVSVLIFPEGTRFPPGQPGKYRASGAALARQADVAILPVAHNAGAFWGAYNYLIHPGTINVHIGALVPAAHLESLGSSDIIKLTRDRIDSMLAK